METLELGRTGIRVSRLCLGTWQVSGWERSDRQTFLKSVRHSVELGINFFDTAGAYGNGLSEEVLGEALRPVRHQVVIASKFLHIKPASIRESLEASLQRLKTDYLDLYQQHWPAREPELSEVISELEVLKAEGKIRAIGVSNWMEPEWDEIDDPARIDCLQPCYSLLWRPIERRVLPLCRDNGIGVIPYSPLCQGILAGRFRSRDDLPTCADDPRRRNRRLWEENFADTLRVVEAVEKIGRHYDRSASQVALRWLLDQEGITAPIVGVSSPLQIEDNVRALEWSLEREHWDELARISAPLSKNLDPHDTLWDWHPRKT